MKNKESVIHLSTLWSKELWRFWQLYCSTRTKIVISFLSGILVGALWASFTEVLCDFFMG
jgi:hypothetical protein